MKIKLRLSGNLEEVMKAEEFLLPDEEIRLSQFFRILADRYGSTILDHLLPEGKFGSHYAILINGRNIKLLKGMETELKDNDRVVVLPLVPGG